MLIEQNTVHHFGIIDLDVLDPMSPDFRRDKVKKYLRPFLWPAAPFIIGLAAVAYLAWWLILRHYGEERPQILQVLKGKK